MTLIKQITERMEKLQEVNLKLKQDFVGLDSIIDQLTENIKTWYVMPDLMTRPMIVNLWGMTGVGKTDLIRKLVKYLSLNDRFIEVQMDDGSETSLSKIQHHLESILENPDDMGILLVDEIQRFRTVDETGMEKQVGRAYSDLWMLLSDGKFESDSKNRMEILDILYDDYMSKDRMENEKKKSKNKNSEETDEIEVSTTMKYKMWTWNARRLKKLLKLEESVEEIMTWDIDTKIQITKKRLMDPVLFEGKMYSKLLIVISGNIDEAYRMAKNVDDVDFDADIFHEYSKKITILDIKNALTQRFKPEQIARFGNIHILYPSLSKQNYRDIIKKKSSLIVQKTIEKHGIDIEIDQSVYETIYLNGVFPTQGVRPVLSTISSIIENSVPKFLLKAMELNEKKIKIRTENDEIVATIGSHELRSKIYTMIENLKKVNSSDKLALTAVHEAGHALVYAIRFGYVPIQLTCDTASTIMGGFMYPSSLSENKERIIWEIECDMAGFAAEEIMFGDSQTSTGHASDMMTATTRASSFVRKFGFDKFIGRYYNELTDKECDFLQNVSDTDKSIEKILVDCKTSAREIINKNIHFYKSIVTNLFEKRSLTAEEIIEIGKSHNIELEYYTKAEILYPGYEKMLIKRLKE